MVNTIPSRFLLVGQKHFIRNRHIFHHILIVIIHIQTQVPYVRNLLFLPACTQNIILKRLYIYLYYMSIELSFLHYLISTLLPMKDISIWDLMFHCDPPLYRIYLLMKVFGTKNHLHSILPFENPLLNPSLHQLLQFFYRNILGEHIIHYLFCINTF